MVCGRGKCQNGRGFGLKWQWRLGGTWQHWPFHANKFFFKLRCCRSLLLLHVHKKNVHGYVLAFGIMKKLLLLLLLLILSSFLEDANELPRAFFRSHSLQCQCSIVLKPLCRKIFGGRRVQMKNRIFRGMISDNGAKNYQNTMDKVHAKMPCYILISWMISVFIRPGGASVLHENVIFVK
jgi:hypothetical protein